MTYDLSVIIPAYNCEKTLPETLDCLLRQSLHNIQIIVVNDGSTDGTPAVIKKYADENDNIVFIDKENGGVSSARNAGLEKAEGTYTVFLDADDLLALNSAEIIVKKMNETRADFGIYRISRFGFGGNEYNPIVDEVAKEKNIDVYDSRLIYCFLIGNKVFRTDVLKKSKARFPATRYSEDGAFIISFLMEARPKITGIYDAECKYRRSDPREIKTVTRSVTKELIADFGKSTEIIESAIKSSFENEDCSCNNKEDYLEEFYCKTCITAVNEFLRQIWLCENDALVGLKNIYDKYSAKLSEKYREKLKKSYTDIGTPIFVKKECAKNPLISVICKNPTEDFINTLYFQTMPCFELISDSKNLNLEKENISSSANANFKVKFSGKKELDPRFLRGMILIKKKAGFLPSSVIKHLTFILLKFKG